MIQDSDVIISPNQEYLDRMLKIVQQCTWRSRLKNAIDICLSDPTDRPCSECPYNGSGTENCIRALLRDMRDYLESEEKGIQLDEKY